jgi:NhaP-type Na+/H+ or K+/H+ antiporter
VFEVAAYTSETAVFIMLGIGMFAFQHPYSEMGWQLFLFTLANLKVARLINIVVCSLLVNCTRTKESKINCKTQFVMWYGGLRGAMAYALALMCALKFSYGPVILLDTLLYSLFTILIQASFLHPILIWAGVVDNPAASNEDDDKVDENELVPGLLDPEAEAEMKHCCCGSCCMSFKDKFGAFE